MDEAACKLQWQPLGRWMETGVFPLGVGGEGREVICGTQQGEEDVAYTGRGFSVQTL